MAIAWMLARGRNHLQSEAMISFRRLASALRVASSRISRSPWAFVRAMRMPESNVALAWRARRQFSARALASRSSWALARAASAASALLRWASCSRSAAEPRPGVQTLRAGCLRRRWRAPWQPRQGGCRRVAAVCPCRARWLVAAGRCRPGCQPRRAMPTGPTRHSRLLPACSRGRGAGGQWAWRECIPPRRGRRSAVVRNSPAARRVPVQGYNPFFGAFTCAF